MLQYFVKYAQQEGIIQPPGLQRKPIKWLVVFSPDGQFLRVDDLTGGDKKSKGREFPSVPQAPNNWLQGGGRSHFLVESLATIVDWPNKPEEQQKIAEKHRFFVDLLRQAASARLPLRSVPELEPIANSLEQGATLQAIRTELASKKAKPTDTATLALETGATLPRIFVEEETWHAWWFDFLTQIGGSTAQMMLDLLTGKPASPHLTHPKIRGLADIGGLATGDVLAGFDKDAFTSYGLVQGQNAAMSQETATIYVTAFNDLISTRCRKLASPKQGTGVKVVFWYSGRVPEEFDPILAVFEEEAEASPMEILQAENRAQKALEAIRTGEHPELAQYQYYAVTLSANSGRVIVRDWMEGRFEELVNNVKAWFNDLSIIAQNGNSIKNSFKFADILGATVRDPSEVQASIASTLWRCALKRTPIPYEVMAQTLRRVHVDIVQDESPRESRFGLLKAFTIRCERVPTMTAELNQHETHPAYLCGRIMALLGDIQRKALGSVGAGVIQRYYAAASATPALVLGRLIRTAQIAHLPKIEQEGLRNWFESQLAHLWSQMKNAPPRTLTLEEQTLFAMGYYHQLAARSQRSQPEAEESPAEQDL